MRLIATLGATDVSRKHRYLIGDKEYYSAFSFEALKAHLGVLDNEVIIIGTKQTYSKHNQRLKPYRFVEVNALDLEDIFAKATEVMEANAVLDLTQSFRSISFGAMLSISFSKTLGKSASDIYYAQTLLANCNPSKEECTFEFISLKRYDEIADLARVINTFLHTMIVLDSTLTQRNIRNLYLGIRKVSESLLNNDFPSLFDTISESESLIKEALSDDQLRYLHHHLSALNRELRAIGDLNRHLESERLLAISRYLSNKSLYLHAITTLYESMVAFIDEECNDEKCTQDKVYDRRHCLKRAFYKRQLDICIPKARIFYRTLSEIDRLRNISAHAFTSDNTDKNIAKILRDSYKKLEEIYQERYSQKKGADRLKAAFLNR